MMKQLPQQTVIKYSSVKILWFVAMILVVLAGCLSFIQGRGILKHIMAGISVAVAAFIACQEFPMLLVLNKPQLIISIKGIEANDGRLYEWAIISNLKIVPMGSVKPTYFLWFETSGGNRNLHLDGLNKRPDQIMELINLYRQMNDQA